MYVGYAEGFSMDLKNALTCDHIVYGVPAYNQGSIWHTLYNNSM